MQLENSFTVPVPIDEAWRVLLDIERIAPCMPGAALDTVDGDDFTGRVKVKLGPINLTYQGKASFIEKDEAAHKAVIDARGKDQRGNGTAAAVVTAKLAAEGSITRVDVLTDLNITGRPAQFGRGVMTDVGNKLLGQFADKLAAQLGEGDAQGDADPRVEPRRRRPPPRPPVPWRRSPRPPSRPPVTAQPARSQEGRGRDEEDRGRRDGQGDREGSAGEGRARQGRPRRRHRRRPRRRRPPPVKAVPPLGDTAPAAADTAPAAARRRARRQGAQRSARRPDGPADPAGDRRAGAQRAVGRPAGDPAAAEEPEPIDLLEVAGGAAMARYAAPAAGDRRRCCCSIVLLVRRRRRRR